MNQDPRAVALAQEICSGLGVGNLSDGGMAILVQHIEEALTDARRQGMEEAAGIAEQYIATTLSLDKALLLDGIAAVYGSTYAIRAQLAPREEGDLE